jgi:hypothetical protein
MYRKLKMSMVKWYLLFPQLRELVLTSGEKFQSNAK